MTADGLDILASGTAMNVGLPFLRECFAFASLEIDEAFLTAMGLDEDLGLLLPMITSILLGVFSSARVGMRSQGYYQLLWNEAKYISTTRLSNVV